MPVGGVPSHYPVPIPTVNLYAKITIAPKKVSTFFIPLENRQ
jgi:hypothetical protein